MSDLEKKAFEASLEGNQAILEKAGEIGETIADDAINGYKAIEKGVVGGYKKIEGGVVGGYKKIEDGVVGAYKKVENAFVDKFLRHEGESVEDAKKRLTEEQPTPSSADDIP